MNLVQKRLLSILAAAAMTCTALPQSASLSLQQPVLTASAGDSVIENLTWSKTAAGTGVTITGYNGNDTTLVIPGTLTDPETSEDLPVTAIGSFAFLRKNTLENVELPDSITEIGTGAFSQCANLKTIKLPESLKIVGNASFGSCPELETIKIPNGVTSIENGAFEKCSKLETIEIPETVTSIGFAAFRDTAWLTAKRNEDPLVIVNHILVDGATCSGEVGIPKEAGVTHINSQAFFYDKQTIIKINGEEKKFNGNLDMTSIKIPDTVTSMGDDVFKECQALKTVDLPDSLTSIGSQAFYKCPELSAISIPDSVTEIGSSVFFGCASLADVKLPAGLTSIPNTMFQDCNNLKEIKIPETVESIGMYAFMNCTGLESIVLPPNVTRIGMYAFRSCTSLKSAEFLNKDTVFQSPSPFGMCNAVTFCGYADSTAEKYALNNNLLFRILGHESDAMFTGASLTLSDDLGLNFYLKDISSDSEAARYSVIFSGKCDEDGTPVPIVKKNGQYCATANITADHMDEQITATLQKDSETIGEFVYSVSQYLNNVNTSDNEALANLVATTKKYGSVSKAYFNTPNNLPEVTDYSDNYFTDTYKPTKKDTDKISLVLDSKLAARLYITGLTEGKTAVCGTETLYAQKSGNGVYFEITSIAPTELASDISITYDEFDYVFKPLSWCYLAAKDGVAIKNKTMANILFEYYTNAKAYQDTL